MSAPSFAAAESDLRSGNGADAEARLRRLLGHDAGNIRAWFLLGQSQQMQSNFRGMLQSANRVCELAPDNRRAVDFQLEALVLCGEISAIRQRLDDLSEAEHRGVERIAKLAEVATQIGDHALAVKLTARALNEAPDDPHLCFNQAASQLALGQIEAAEESLDKVISAQPEDGDAWYNRSTLRRQNETQNHVVELQSTLAAVRGKPSEVPVRFAMAKEFEDLGEYSQGFSQLAKASALRSSRMQYKSRDDCLAMEQIASAFDAGYLEREIQSDLSDSPILVTGLPRSGTTLVDRILSSHDDVTSVGEVNDLPLAVMEVCGSVQNKAELIAKSALAAPEAIGWNYVERLAQRAPDARRIVDKTPLNFLYLGLIAKALPNAAIVHVRREPMDVAYAMFKTLFRMGYPFTYSFEDLAEYMAGKEQLMSHWRRILPNRIIEIDYEEMVSDQEGTSRRLLQRIGLNWQPQVLDFHRNVSPSATASAAQVRQPVHSRSVGLWRRYESELAPLRLLLTQRGLLT